MRFASILFYVIMVAWPLRADVPDCRGAGLRCVELTSASGRIQVPTPWRTEIDLSDFAGTNDVFLSSRSEKALRCGEGHATLFLRCLQDRTALFIWHGCVVPSDQQLFQVEMSIDGGAVETLTWQVGGEAATLGLWAYDDARRLIEKFYGADRVALRYEDALGLKREMAFPITGLKRAIVPLRIACGWSEDWTYSG